jgi:hypothetical protein
MCCLRIFKQRESLIILLPGFVLFRIPFLLVLLLQLVQFCVLRNTKFCRRKATKGVYFRYDIISSRALGFLIMTPCSDLIRAYHAFVETCCLFLLLLPLALQPTVGFGLSNKILPFIPIRHQLSPSSLNPSSFFLCSTFVTIGFYCVGLLAPRQTPTWRTRVSLFVGVITLDLSGMGGPTSSIRHSQHSSWDHVTTQAPPLRHVASIFRERICTKHSMNSLPSKPQY